MKVGDEHRINPLSLKPGGSTVTILYKSGVSREYDKVKDPKAYLDRISNSASINLIFVDAEMVYKHDSSENSWEPKK